MAKQESGKSGKRRGHGEGSVTQHTSGLWVARLDLGYIDGKRKRKDLYAKTQREAIEKLAKARRELQQGMPVAVERQTVADYMAKWLGKGATLLNIRQSTYQSYEELTRLYIVPAVGKRPMSKLSAADLNAAYARMLERGLSARTVQYTHAVLRRALKDALRQDLIPRNPADVADVPRPQKKEIVPPTIEQCLLFLRAAIVGRVYALYVLAITCGARQGELLGLKWPDVNLGEAELHIRRKIYPLEKGGFLISEPKTAKGKRMIALPSIAVEALRYHQEKQAEERAAAGHLWKDEGWVFPNTEGGLERRRNLVRRSFKPLLEQAGLPSTTRFHDMRHAMATIMLGDGTHPKIVQERLGHSSISVTLDVYSHVKPKLQKEAAARFDEHFAGLIRPDAS